MGIVVPSCLCKPNNINSQTKKTLTMTINVFLHRVGGWLLDCPSTSNIQENLVFFITHFGL
jgi:hypothetical protein